MPEPLIKYIQNPIRLNVTSVKYISVLAVILALFVLAVFPEPPARLLTPIEGWKSSAPSDAMTALNVFSGQIRYTRASTANAPGGVLFRTWSPSTGTKPIELESAPFRPAPYMSVLITGKNRTITGEVHAYVECVATGQERDVFSGGVGVNVNEAILTVPPAWCPSDVQLKLTSAEQNTLVGVGSVYEISWLSWFKSTFLGKLPYLLISLLAFSLVMLSGASAFRRYSNNDDLLLPAFVTLGLGALASFYLTSALLIEYRWGGALLVLVASLGGLMFARRDARKATFQSLFPYFQVWWLASLIYASILGLADSGLGHWGPDYRFWPAVWNPDNELPWVFAEAVRNGWVLKDLFGFWLPTDRPPLMTGAYLLLSDIFKFLQSGNDGLYLRGQVYNNAAISLNALWAPAVWWGLRKLVPTMKRGEHLVILLFIGSLPMVLFNTTFGWPKYFGASFAILACVVAISMRDLSKDQPLRTLTIFFFMLCALSILSHASTALFLIPLGIFFLIWNRQCKLGDLAMGFGVAFVLLASWALYKFLVLPSTDVLTKYALTGDLGYYHKDQPLLTLLREKYSALTVPQWLSIKGEMLLQSFVPFHQQLNNLDLNFDAGSDPIDRLRAWDMFMLSKGNLGVLFLFALSIMAFAGAYARRRYDEVKLMTPFMFLIMLGLCSWILIVLGFFVPIIIHHWPQAALFALALGSAVVAARQFPRVLKYTTFITLGYTLIVWVFHPLKNAMGVDWGAATTLLAVLLSIIVHYWTVWQKIDLQQENQRGQKMTVHAEEKIGDHANRPDSKRPSFFLNLSRFSSFGSIKSAVIAKFTSTERQYISNRLDGIEALRAYAALAIIFFHLAAVGHVEIPESIAFIKSHFGFGVPLFFVVSAFCMAYGYSGKLYSYEALKNYFIRRFTRIAPLFYFMLVFQLVLLWLVFDVTRDKLDIFLNVIFAFNLAPHMADGIVPASWSIGVEMLFYAVFPIAILFASNFWRALFLLLGAILMATQFSIDMKSVVDTVPSFVYHNFLTNFPYFAWGLLGFYIYRLADKLQAGSSRKLFSWLTCGASVALMILLYKNTELYMFFWNRGLRTTWDSLWGIPFAMLCIGLAVHPTRILSNLVTRYLGRISFSLYLAHPTVIYYLWKWGFYNKMGGVFSGNIWFGFCASAVITIAIIAVIATVMYRYIEVPGMSLGQRLTKRNPSGLSVPAAMREESRKSEGKVEHPELTEAKPAQSPVKLATHGIVGGQAESRSVAGILSIAFFIYVLAGATIGHPTFGSDEYAFFIQGKFLHMQAELLQLDPYLQQIGSPLFLYMLHWLAKLGLADFTGIVRIIHAAEYCLTAYVLVRIFQDVCSRKYLIAGLIAFLLLPGAIFMLAVMPEMELLLVSALVAYVLIVRFPVGYFRAATYAGVLLGIGILIKPHVLAIIASAIMMIYVSSFLGLPKANRASVAARANLLLLAMAYLTYIVLWRICTKEWSFDPTAALGLNLYGTQLSVNAPAFVGFQRIVDTLRYVVAHLTVLLLIFTPVFMAMAENFKGAYSKIKGRQAFVVALENRQEMAILFTGLMLLFHVLMSAYFTAGAASFSQGEAMRLQGRYIGAAIIFLPFLSFIWLSRPSSKIGRPIVLVSLLAGLLCYFWIFKKFKIYPWDHPLLYSFFTYPNRYGWGFDSKLPFVGTWLLFALLTGYLLTLFRTRWIKPFMMAQIFMVLVVGMYQTSNWLFFHTSTNANLFTSSQAISSLLNDPRAGRGVFISDERYGSMSYVLYGLATAPKVIVRSPKEEISQADVQGYDWVLLGNQYVPKFFYSSEIALDKFKLYLINTRIITHEHEKELLLSGKELFLPLGAGREGGLRLHGFNAQKGWGAVAAEANTRLELPFLIKGPIRLRVFGWVPKESPTHKLTVRSGGSSAVMAMTEAPSEHEISIRVSQQTDSIMFEIPTIHPQGESRDVGVAIGYIKIEALTK